LNSAFAAANAATTISGSQKPLDFAIVGLAEHDD